MGRRQLAEAGHCKLSEFVAIPRCAGDVADPKGGIRCVLAGDRVA